MSHEPWAKSLIGGYIDGCLLVIKKGVFNDVFSRPIIEIPTKSWESVLQETLDELIKEKSS